MNPEQEQNKIIEEESTIFGKSPTKTDDKPAKKGKMLKNIISLVLVLAVLIGAAAAIIKLIPETEDDTSTPETEKIAVVDLEQKQVKSVTVTRADSVSVYNSELSEVAGDESGKTETKVNWTIAGIDPSLTETTSISMLMDTALNLSASREIEKEEGADYGFSSPLYKVEIVGYNTADSKTLLIGKETPTASGHYATADGGQTVYLLDSSDVEEFATTDEEMSTSKIILAAEETQENAAYFEEGALSGFDYITLSGKAYEKAMRFENNSDETMAAYVPYVMTLPAKRYADATLVAELLGIAKNGLNGVCAYVYSPTAADLSAYGLQNPDVSLTIASGTIKVSIKATMQQDGYYALVADGAPNIIFKVSANSLSFGQKQLVEFTGDTVFAEMITELKEIEFWTSNGSFTFKVETIAAEDESKNDTLNIYFRDKKLTTENFQNYYQYVASIDLTEATFEPVTGKSEYIVITKRADGTSSKLEMINYTDRRYYVEVNDVPIGFVSTTTFEKLIEYLPMVAEDQTIPEPY